MTQWCGLGSLMTALPSIKWVNRFLKPFKYNLANIGKCREQITKQTCVLDFVNGSAESTQHCSCKSQESCKTWVFWRDGSFPGVVVMKSKLSCGLRCGRLNTSLPAAHQRCCWGRSQERRQSPSPLHLLLLPNLPKPWTIQVRRRRKRELRISAISSVRNLVRTGLGISSMDLTKSPKTG